MRQCLKELNFLFRISTARVEAETSMFTALPGVKRVIMILEGELELEHTGHYLKTLKKSETDIFSGDWETKSRGKVTDFNLMTTGATGGTVEMIKLPAGDPFSLSNQGEENFVGIYLLKGEMIYESATDKGILEAGDFLLGTAEKEDESLILRSESDCEFISVKIHRSPFTFGFPATKSFR